MIKVDYLHIHMMVIIDVGYNDYGYTELMICTNKSITMASLAIRMAKKITMVSLNHEIRNRLLRKVSI